MSNNFEAVKKELAESLEKYYEDTIKAIIAIEKNLVDNDVIDYVYNDYMEGNYMLMNDCIDDAICKYEQKNNNRLVNSRKTLENVKSELDNYKKMNSTRGIESKAVYNQRFER